MNYRNSGVFEPLSSRGNPQRRLLHVTGLNSSQATNQPLEAMATLAARLVSIGN